MKTLRGMLVSILLCCLVPAGPTLAETTDRVLATIPWRSADVLREIYTPLIDLLDRKLGWKVRLVVTRDYAELNQRLHEGFADIGVIGPKGYVDAKLADPGLRYLATAKRPQDHYFSLIITRKGSGLATAQDCRGRSFAFTDRDSASGYLYPRILLHRAGVDADTDLGKVFLLEKHDKVFDAVARGRVDAGGVSITAWDDAVARNGDVYRIIARSAPIPRNALVAANHMSAEDFQRLQAVLREAEQDADFRANSTTLTGFSVRDDSFYDVVREARRFAESVR